MLCYSAFFTMAGIALTRCFHITSDQSRQDKVRKIFQPKMASLGCLLIWLLSFILLSPVTFGADRFGTFGYDHDHGICEVTPKDWCKEIKDWKKEFNISPSGWYFLIATSLPCLVIVSSYLVLSLFISTHARSLPESAQAARRNSSQVNTTILSLSLAFVLFTTPLIPVEMGILDYYFCDNTAAYSIAIRCWYWWIFGSNCLIYLATTQDFRTIYRIFLRDLMACLGAHSLAAQISPD